MPVLTSGGESSDAMGSYYVLEVGNFDPVQSPASTESGHSDPAPDAAGTEPAGSCAVPGEGGYYMLNTNDPTLSEDSGDSYSYVPQCRLANYVNAVVLKPGVVSVGAKAIPPSHQEGGATPKLHPHLIMAGEEEMDKTGQASSVSVRSEGRASRYENVCPPGEREVLPVPAAAVGVASQGSRVALSATEDTRGMYENVSLKPRPSRSSGTSNSHSENPEVKRSDQQRQNVYEVIGFGGRKVNGGEGLQNRHSNCQSPENGKESNLSSMPRGTYMQAGVLPKGVEISLVTRAKV